MYIIKNAWRNTRRAKGRSLLIGLIVLMIAFASCIALIIKESAETTAQDALAGLTVTATIGVDRQALMEQATEDGGDPGDAMDAVSSLTLDEMQSYAESDAVDDFTYTIQTSVSGTDDLEAVATSEDTFAPSDQGGDMPSTPEGTDSSGSSDQRSFSMGDFTLIGVNSAAAMTGFTSGENSMTDGAVFEFGEDNGDCVISEELATLNGISVGDTITFANPDDEDTTYDLTVTGIFSSSEDTSSTGGGRGFFGSMDPANQVYTTYETLSGITESDDTLISSVSGTYILASPEAFEAFEADVRDMGLSDEYSVTSTDLDQYENSLLPLTNLKKFALVLLAVVLGVGGVILALISIFAIRERKYEVGVLTAIGMKKNKVALQFLSEAFIIALIAVIVGTGLGAAFSKPVANAMLSDQISSIQEQQSDQTNQFGRDVGDMSGRGGPSDSQSSASVGSGDSSTGISSYIDTLSPSMSLSVLLSLVGICLLLTLLASVAALVFVMRFEPMRILSERE